jgi:hypothetical protein
MSYNAGNKRRRAKARRTSNSPSVCMPSLKFTSFNHSQNKEIGQKGCYDTNKRSFTQEPTSTYADATRSQSRTRHTPTISNPTYHIVEKDPGFPHPFDPMPHLLLTCRYSASNLFQNELVFRYVFQPRHAATRELSQSYHTNVMRAIGSRMGINLQATNAHGDTITVVT